MNGYPTGVDATDAMVHGRPYPASTNFGTISVGAMSIRRFLRPVCHQNVWRDIMPLDLVWRSRSTVQPSFEETIRGNAMPDREHSDSVAEVTHGSQGSLDAVDKQIGKDESLAILERLDRIERQLAFLVARQPGSFGDTDRGERK